MPEDKQVRKLRRQAEKALAKQQIDDAIVLLGKLAERDPRTPRWPHKRGDLLRKQGDKARAVECYTTAVDLYADQGFIARAVAMAKTVLNLDPSRIDVLERVDPEAARQLHRQQRPQGASLVPPTHPMVIPDDAPPAPPPAPPQAHPMVIPDDAPSGADPADVTLPGAPPLPDLPPLPGEAPAGGGARPPKLPGKRRARRRPPGLDDDVPLPGGPQRRPRRARRRHPSLDDLSIPPPGVTNLHKMRPAPSSDTPDRRIPAAPPLPTTRADTPLLSQAPPL